MAAKWRCLVGRLEELDSLLVAFSGGVDSSLLLAVARRVLGDRVQAGMCLGPFTPSWEAERARALARSLGVKLHEMDACELDDSDIVRNDPQRCYFCKRLRLGRLMELAQELGIAAVAEGSQADDAQDFRPGERAVKELGLISPLAEAGLGKAEVRTLSRALGLPTADLPAAACLASRVPWGTALTPRPWSASAGPRRASGSCCRATSGCAIICPWPAWSFRLRTWPAPWANRCAAKSWRR